MPFDFSTQAKRARAQIPVPEVPMETILAASASRKRGHVRTLVLSAAISAAMIGTAAAFGTNIYNGIRLWISGDKGTLVVQSFAMVRNPREADLRRIVNAATFPVILPTGLPAGMHIWAIQYAPADHPTVISIDYRRALDARGVGFTLFDSSGIHLGNPSVPAGIPRVFFRNGIQWHVGNETVLSMPRLVAPPIADRIRKSMLKISPSASLAATRPMLANAILLGLTPDIQQQAAAYASANGYTVVIGSSLLRTIQKLARDGRPLLDTRTVYLTNIPSSNGEPDYTHATLRWSSTAAVSAAGVRAIDSVLHLTGTENGCGGCAVLFSRSDNAFYAVGEMRRLPVPSLQKYLVDARTFAVKAAP